MDSRFVKPLAVFIVIVTVVLGGTAVLAALSGTTATPDGERIQGQSPAQFQPEAVNREVDPETGEIAIDTDEDDGRILIDTRHGNEFARSDLDPIVSAAFEAGHSVEFDQEEASLDETLDGYDGYLVIQPTEGFSESERAALRSFAEDGGHVVVLAEPTQSELGQGLFASLTTVSFGPEELAASYGVRVGPEMLYNSDDEANDNNFKSIYTTPTGQSPLSRGVETVTFDRGGYAVVRESGDTEVLFTAAEGTRTLETRRTGTYPTVVRNDSVVFVTDSSFINPIELYDADNEVFVGNLLEFLVRGERSGSASGPATGGGESTPTATPTPTPSNGTGS